MCSKFTEEHSCWSAISIKLQNNFIEITLRRGCSPVNLVHIFRTTFPKNASGGLLQKNIGDIALDCILNILSQLNFFLERSTEELLKLPRSETRLADYHSFATFKVSQKEINMALKFKKLILSNHNQTSSKLTGSERQIGFSLKTLKNSTQWTLDQRLCLRLLNRPC